MTATHETFVGGAEADMQQFLLVNSVSALTDRIPSESWRPFNHDTDRPSIRYPYFQVGQIGRPLDEPGSMRPTDLFMPLYGERLVVAGGNLHLEIAGHEAIEQIGTLLRDEILVNEGIRVGRITQIPDDMRVESDWYDGQDYVGHPSWLLKWLKSIHSGTWPIMSRKIPDVDNSGGFTDDPYRHDLSEVQLGNLALGPREIQIEYTGVAWYEFAARRASTASNHHVDGLILSGESPYENDPLAYYRGSAANPRIFHNGVAELENVTNDYTYMRLLSNLVVVELGERLQLFDEASSFMQLDGGELKSEVLNYVTSNYGTGPESLKRAKLLASMTNWLQDQASAIVSVANFNCRVENRRNLSIAEQRQKVESYFSGILRVAGKLRGDFDPAA